MSRTYQLGQLKEWIELTPINMNRRPGDPLYLQRVL
jgi:hypothetical protein